MKKVLVLTCVVLCIIGIFAVWYFGHQRSDQKELKSESKNSVLIENHPQEESSVPESTQKTGKGNTAGEIDSEKVDPNAADGTTKNVVLEGGKEHQNCPLLKR